MHLVCRDAIQVHPRKRLCRSFRVPFQPALLCPLSYPKQAYGLEHVRMCRLVSASSGFCDGLNQSRGSPCMENNHMFFSISSSNYCCMICRVCCRNRQARTVPSTKRRYVSTEWDIVGNDHCTRCVAFGANDHFRLQLCVILARHSYGLHLLTPSISLGDSRFRTSTPDCRGHNITAIYNYHELKIAEHKGTKIFVALNNYNGFFVISSLECYPILTRKDSARKGRFVTAHLLWCEVCSV